MTQRRREVSEFLASRRAKITPSEAGLPDFGRRRRVPGLRREEVALLAGVSPDDYVSASPHPVVGALDLAYEAFELPGDPGLTMLVYTAEPSSPTQDALAMLASWAAPGVTPEVAPDRIA
jgi:hypothetical protein